PPEAYVVYFTGGGGVEVQLAGGPYSLRWIDANTGEWSGADELTARAPTLLQAPGEGHWLAVIVRR
ncbi:MAG: hypothetical protein GY953_28045, partial [bacterium]|nr:hypothetical protein [bacterium]